MDDTVIRVENLGKQYRIGTSIEAYGTLRDSLGKVFKPRKDQDDTDENGENFIWALRGLNFEVKQGQVLGVIGRNGAGKSTLLKILSRVTYPTEGFAEIRGRVGSLLEVGTGFHPELSGRENILLNGAILGMKRTEIEKKFDEIVDFAEIEKFIDTPVKRYSSGMYLRLAFAVAAHLEPEILVVDEVLAVGDAEFQRKCLGKMSDVAQQGRTVLFVSHNMSAVLRLTEESLVIEKGKLAMRAPSGEAVDYYLSRGYSLEGQRVWHADEIPQDAYPFQPVAIRVKNPEGTVVDTVRSIQPATIELEYNILAPMTGLRVGIYLISTRGEYIFTSFDTDDAGEFERFGTRQPGNYRSRCVIPADTLNEGRYIIGVNASTYRIKRYFQDEQALTFNVDAAGAPGMQWPEPRLGSYRPRLNWEIERV
ncbi:MAG TPA: ABC transporter ATP-binding protein [Anaerolineaceae bacterium]|nr:ABC transporter ATP-binding protein [Anaerolineaceae bacterium]HQN04123.1 ABC transporter ATP-binding protein [Anaerolineaceae bacterium]HQP08641.1 ABC transporter ATP-binding protein [Anaerolineaceae bacterium]